ncbi:uncharacterized protein LOC112556052 [Pomacea canaliculata]|uniref:uncharacterized protein LOC112556052 n=1 Tax=Pomacea canaliculata TaxID=400727 RepID=UPI000D7265E6|nr:uncharacterized protein LOC112556052 [Pomacea canaliculata]
MATGFDPKGVKETDPTSEEMKGMPFQEKMSVEIEGHLEQEREKETHCRRLENEVGSTPSNPCISTYSVKLPVFDEAVEDLDTFLGRFECVAQLQNWDVNSWGVMLGGQLRGRAAEVYLSLTDTERRDYEAVKVALREAFQLTPDSYRCQFRNERRLDRETFPQFATRLTRYVERWLSLSGKETKYEDLLDLVLQEQMLEVIGGEMAIYLRQCSPKTVKELAMLAERYADARRAAKRSPGVPGRTDYGQKDRNELTEQAGSQEITCFNCGKPGHIKKDCKNRKQSFVPGNSSKVTVVRCADQPAQSETGSYNPYCLATVGEKTVKALRDTGADVLVVDADLVAPTDLLPTHCSITMACKNEVLSCPTALVRLQSPFYCGEAITVVLANLVVPVIIGNHIERRDGTKVQCRFILHYHQCRHQLLQL